MSKDMSNALACQLMPNADFLSEFEFRDDKGNLREFAVEISGISEDDLQLPGRSMKEKKPVLSFKGRKKRLVLNKTNIAACKAMWGGKLANWIGKKVPLYYDPTIKFGPKVVGGVRVGSAK